MKIIELTELQFNNYSKIHSKRNSFQTIEYAKSQLIYNFSILYLGLIDDQENLLGATLILEQPTLKKYKIGYIPGGFLIDYNNFELLSNFTNYLKKYLQENGYVYIRTNSLIECKRYTNSFKLIFDNSQVKNNLINLGYSFVKLEDNFLKYRTILEGNNIENTYYKFDRNTKRNINNALKMGISVIEGKGKIENFYNFIKKKDKKSINYYKNIVENFNNRNNSSEIYFAVLDGKTFINNTTYLLRREEQLNSQLNIALQQNKDQKILNRKMTSDKLIEKYNNYIRQATQIYKEYPKGLILSSCLILKNNKEIYFLTSGYEEKYRKIRSLELLKWEIIKKYLNKKYEIFNLGEISNNFNDRNDKYFGYNKAKLGFSGYIVENVEVFDLIINKFLYNIINATKIFNLNKKNLNK